MEPDHCVGIEIEFAQLTRIAMIRFWVDFRAQRAFVLFPNRSWKECRKRVELFTADVPANTDVERRSVCCLN